MKTMKKTEKALNHNAFSVYNGIMKNTFAFFLGLFFVVQCNAQLGFVAAYKTFDAPGWEASLGSILNEAPYPKSGWDVGLDYWFRLKKRRIEFMPEVSFASYKHDFSNGESRLKQFGLHFNTAIYVFDLASDCNCPTFSKDGNLIGKGFFVELSPGVSYFSNEIIGESTIGAYYPRKVIALGGSIGAGLDLGFSDLFTVTPIARFFFYPSVQNLDDLQPAQTVETDVKQVFVGLRFRLHFKEMAKARYR